MQETSGHISLDPSEWSSKDFQTFLLIHASYADLEFSDSEKKAILTTVSSHRFGHIHEFYKQMSEYECLEFILLFKPRFFANEEQKNQLLKLISEQFMADGEVSKLEVNFLDFLKRLI